MSKNIAFCEIWGNKREENDCLEIFAFEQVQSFLETTVKGIKVSPSFSLAIHRHLWCPSKALKT